MGASGSEGARGVRGQGGARVARGCDLMANFNIDVTSLKAK